MQSVATRWLQISLKKINMIIYLENLTIELHVLYFFLTHVQFVSISCYLLFYTLNLFFMQNFRLQKLEI